MADWPSQADQACWRRKVQTSRRPRPIGMLLRNEGMPHPIKDPEVPSPSEAQTAVGWND